MLSAQENFLLKLKLEEGKNTHAALLYANETKFLWVPAKQNEITARDTSYTHPQTQG